MLTLNTNLTGLITQSSLKSSTSRLNQAIEQMTSGFKINHAKDNAANYSISTNMSTKISAYQIAEENVNMGLDLLSTANDILSSMQDKAARLSALSTQARNGTYGASSLAAINAEANAIITELMRDYNNAEYNKISLFNNTTAGSGGGGSGGGGAAPTTGESGFINESGISDAYKAGASKFIADIVEETPQIVVSNPDELASAISSYTKIGIKNAETLAKLSDLVNSGTTCSGKIIILTDDIDLSAYSNWQPIGTSYSKNFKGTFNGNGHVVRKLTINRPTESYVGLFGYAYGGTIKNVGIENADVKGKSMVGGLAGNADSGSITNSYATGTVTGQGDYVGGLVGEAAASITNSYATGDVSGNKFVGGLVGRVYAASGTLDITDSYSLGMATGASGVGLFIGAIVNTTDGINFGTINITGCQALDSGGDVIGGAYKYASTHTPITYDMTDWLNGITLVSGGGGGSGDGGGGESVSTALQVGVNGQESSRIEFNTNFQFDFTSLQGGMEKDSTFDAIRALNALLSAKQTDLGAVQNRLESALEEIATNYDNLVSSRSTLRDADIAEVSSRYIQQQILQQASATLMATANQTPAIALQLI